MNKTREQWAGIDQQADPTDTFTAVDMATAAAQAFRDGQAAVEQAPEPRDKRVRPSYLDQAVIDRVAESSARHLEEIGRGLAEPAPAQDERTAFEAWVMQHNTAVREDYDDTDENAPEDIRLDRQGGVYIWANAEAAWFAWKTRSALDTRPAQTAPVPSAAQQILDLIMEECRYWHGRDEARRGNFANLYAAAKELADNTALIAQTAPQPEQSGLVLPHAQLERIERRLTDWLELNCCECESGHSCGRNEVTADRDAIRAALSAQGAGKFAMRQRVRKTSGSEWQGRICGTYSTALTPEGYAVESESHAGSVQIYPAKALEAVE